MSLFHFLVASQTAFRDCLALCKWWRSPEHTLQSPDPSVGVGSYFTLQAWCSFCLRFSWQEGSLFVRQGWGHCRTQTHHFSQGFHITEYVLLRAHVCSHVFVFTMSLWCAALLLSPSDRGTKNLLEVCRGNLQWSWLEPGSSAVSCEHPKCCSLLPLLLTFPQSGG